MSLSISTIKSISFFALSSGLLFNSLGSMLNASEIPSTNINFFNGIALNTANSPAEESLLLNPALKRVPELNILLADPTLSSSDKLMYSKELFGILTDTGAASSEYGPLSGPITQVDLSSFPIDATPPVISPNHTAWLNDHIGYFPTNDWFQQMGTYPRSTASTDSGVYTITYNSNGSLNYNSPIDFEYYQSDINPYHASIEQKLDNGFTLDTASTLNPHPFVKWEPARVGNMVRHIVYNQMTYYVAQGSAFQAASYRNDFPLIGLQDPNPRARFSQEKLSDGTQKYRIETDQQLYLFYGNKSLDLAYNPSSGKLQSSNPYTGMINAISIPKNKQAKKFEQLADAHSTVVIVRGQGSLLLDGAYEFTFMCQDLNGSPTANDPLIFLKEHLLKNYINNGLAKSQGIANLSLTGYIKLFSGSAFCFKASSPRVSTIPIPYLSNGMPGITQLQAQKVISKGKLDKGIEQALAFQPSPTFYEGGKGIYQIALTLGYAQQVLEIAKYPPKYITNKLNPLHQKLMHQFTIMWSLLENDAVWGSIVPKSNDQGSESSINNHISQYGYILYSLALLSDFEEKYLPASNRFLPKNVSIPNYSAYTNKDMGDFLAADIGETGYSANHPLYRNFDIYNGHSWLSGINGPQANGTSTESQSEAVFGSFSLVAWLNRTQQGSIQASFSRTRWNLETQALNTYFHIGNPKHSVYSDVSKSFTKKHPAVSALWGNKVADETSYGNSWDRILSCSTTPAGANLMDNYLNGNLAFAKRAADYILKNWNQSRMINPIQSTLIAIVAKTYPDEAQKLLNSLENSSNKNMDPGTNSFILYLITLYAENEQKLKTHLM